MEPRDNRRMLIYLLQSNSDVMNALRGEVIKLLPDITSVFRAFFGLMLLLIYAEAKKIRNTQKERESREKQRVENRKSKQASSMEARTVQEMSGGNSVDDINKPSDRLREANVLPRPSDKTTLMFGEGETAKEEEG